MRQWIVQCEDNCGRQYGLCADRRFRNIAVMLARFDTWLEAAAAACAAVIQEQLDCDPGDEHWIVTETVRAKEVIK